MTRLFGTDGIRGLANKPPLTTELAFRLGRQLVATLIQHDPTKKTRLVVGRDTRLSGPMLEGALVSGALSAGGDVYAVGVLPTPAIAFLTRRLEAHGGRGALGLAQLRSRTTASRSSPRRAPSFRTRGKRRSRRA